MYITRTYTRTAASCYCSSHAAPKLIPLCARLKHRSRQLRTAPNQSRNRNDNTSSLALSVLWIVLSPLKHEAKAALPRQTRVLACLVLE